MNKLQTVTELITYNEEKLSLLKEWQKNIAIAIKLSDEDEFEKSDKIDDRCIEIEEHFETEYNIEFDSCGDINNVAKDKAETVSELVDYNEKKLALLKEWQENAEAEQELAEGACLDETDGFDERCIEIEDILESDFDIKLDS